MIAPDLETRAARLNARYRNHAAVQVLRHALADPELGRVALVSSFGAESVVLLHMLSVAAPDTPVLFVDTRMLFPETLEYQRQIAAALPLTDIRVIRADDAALAEADPDGRLHQRDTDACCDLRKVVPLERALSGFDAWITGRKRFQGGERSGLDFFEPEPPLRLRVNPLAHWRPQDVAEYMEENALPRHPLVARGYPSIGCAPCTSAVKAGEDPRAGRWRGAEKTECGIHFIGGKPRPVAPLPAEPVSAPRPSAAPLPLRGAGPGPLSKDDEMTTAAPTAPARQPAAAAAGPAAAPADAPVLVRDDGFHPVDTAPDVALPPDSDPAALAPCLGASLVAVEFPAMTDGRGFTLARLLREQGFSGRIRATGALIADQYAMARRVGIDEVQIPAELARRQPQEQWLARADWQDWDHRSRLAG
ncbi:phosophoadenylyl-sulfate reductase (thioredoxin) [Paracoccus alkenifer]|uniref:Adenosine 5'-phosphosulfate reductase n=2 Tax=Paracoccus alkenifer TaxID=65735 RepID=A0A1H6MBN0_9RHOB|nr:phosophoadenylyl-sulfate reductase (thioredoxin) [Paracoccus alkenifer]